MAIYPKQVINRPVIASYIIAFINLDVSQKYQRCWSKMSTRNKNSEKEKKNCTQLLVRRCPTHTIIRRTFFSTFSLERNAIFFMVGNKTSQLYYNRLDRNDELSMAAVRHGFWSAFFELDSLWLCGFFLD
jgi:hypothetical protein